VITVATTLTGFAMDDPDTWGSWLINAEAIIDSHPQVSYFAAIETDARGLEPFAPLIDRMKEIGGNQWQFSLDDGRTSVTTENRLRHITMGQNLCVDAALSAGASHLLFLAADLEPPPDCLPKLLEVDWPIVGGHIPTYCLDGPVALRGNRNPPTGMSSDFYRNDGEPFYPGMDVRVHMASAAFILLRRDMLNKVRWRWDVDAGRSDDPCMWHDCRTFHGIETLVRHDCVGKHHPESIGPVEHRGHDMTVHR
jgi:hypothetical protein